MYVYVVQHWAPRHAWEHVKVYKTMAGAKDAFRFYGDAGEVTFHRKQRWAEITEVRVKRDIVARIVRTWVRK